jgi:transcriptional regulator with XRE-family HTH domain
LTRLPKQFEPSRLRIAANVRRLRDQLGLTQGEVGERANLHRTYIVSIEKGERNVSIDNVDRLADALLVTPRDLLKP